MKAEKNLPASLSLKAGKQNVYAGSILVCFRKFSTRCSSQIKIITDLDTAVGTRTLDASKLDSTLGGPLCFFTTNITILRFFLKIS